MIVSLIVNIIVIIREYDILQRGSALCSAGISEKSR